MNNDQLKILVIGAGPSGLAFSIELAQRWQEAKNRKQNMIGLQITIRDLRIEQRDGDGVYVNVGARSGRMPGRRRDQVVTIQEDVMAHLSPLLNTYLLENFNENVWPTSRNIPIQEIEDQLLLLAQTSQFKGVLCLEAVTDQNWKANTDSFHIIVGADGAASKTRRELFGVKDDEIKSYGEDTALGIAFQVPENEYQHGLPFEQKVNCILTLAQRRYLLNASKVTRSGYLNIQLSRDEMANVLTKDKQACVWTNPGYLTTTGDDSFKPYYDHYYNTGTNESRRLWEVIMDGLTLFGIKKRHVTNIIGIRLPIRYSPSFTFELAQVTGGGSMERWGFLVGDAAFQTHFWPGRGLNSAFKEIAMLVWCLTDVFSAHNRLRRNEIIHINYFNSFVNALRDREHTHRSRIFLCGNSMIEHVKKAIDQREQCQPAKSDLLFKRIVEARDRIDRPTNPNLNNKDLTSTFKELDINNILDELSIFSINVMIATGIWPNAPGEEILPRDFIGRNEFWLPANNENVSIKYLY